MFIVSTEKFGNATERLDLDSLQIDGQPAHQMPPDKLYRALKQRGVLGIIPQTGKQELLVAFARWRAAQP
jgi:hypothetical protein